MSCSTVRMSADLWGSGSQWVGVNDFLLGQGFQVARLLTVLTVNLDRTFPVLDLYPCPISVNGSPCEALRWSHSTSCNVDRTFLLSYIPSLSLHSVVLAHLTPITPVSLLFLRQKPTRPGLWAFARPFPSPAPAPLHNHLFLSFRS